MGDKCPFCNAKVATIYLGRGPVFECNTAPGFGDEYIRGKQCLENELAALKERLEKAVDALDKLARLGNEPHYGNSIGNTIAQDTLTAISTSAPSDLVLVRRSELEEIADALEEGTIEYLNAKAALEGKP